MKVIRVKAVGLWDTEDKFLFHVRTYCPWGDSSDRVIAKNLCLQERYEFPHIIVDCVIEVKVK